MRKKILFGIGQIGKNALMFYGRENVHCFVDNNPEKVGNAYKDVEIISFNQLKEIHTDYDIVITALAYDAISQQLFSAGITSFEKYRNPTIFEYLPAIKPVIPKELVSSDRLDVAVKYLYAKDIISKIDDSPAKALYARMILAWSGAIEASNEKLKLNLDEHFRSFEQLCESIQKEGFKETDFIPIKENNTIFNGAHRLAAALALDRNAYAGVVGTGAGISRDVTFRFFEENGFSRNDKIRILRGFADLFDECGIIVLFAPIKEQWNYVISQMQKDFKLVGSVDIDLSHNYIAFEILVKEIYGEYFNVNGIHRKISLLKMSPLELRVVLVSNEKEKLETNEFYDKLTAYKNSIREMLGYDLNAESYCLFHASECFREHTHLKNVLLSVNNINTIEGRVSSLYREEFLYRTIELRKICKEKCVSIEDVCLSGSTTMDVYGIRESMDDDIIVSSGLSQEYPADSLFSEKLPLLQVITRLRTELS